MQRPKIAKIIQAFGRFSSFQQSRDNLLSKTLPLPPFTTLQRALRGTMPPAHEAA